LIPREGSNILLTATPLGLDLVSGAGFWCNLHYFPNRIRFRGFRAPPRAPEGRKAVGRLLVHIDFTRKMIIRSLRRDPREAPKRYIKEL
jgi:hypothetical protein